MRRAAALLALAVLVIAAITVALPRGGEEPVPTPREERPAAPAEALSAPALAGSPTAAGERSVISMAEEGEGTVAFLPSGSWGIAVRDLRGPIAGPCDVALVSPGRRVPLTVPQTIDREGVLRIGPLPALFVRRAAAQRSWIVAEARDGAFEVVLGYEEARRRVALAPTPDADGVRWLVIMLSSVPFLHGQVVDPDGHAILGAHVRVAEREVRTDARGVWVVALSEDEGRNEFEGSAAYGPHDAETTGFRAMPGVASTVVLGGPAITGSVRYADGAPVADAYIVTNPDAPGTRTRSDGGFRIGGVRAQERYAVRVHGRRSRTPVPFAQAGGAPVVLVLDDPRVDVALIDAATGEHVEGPVVVEERPSGRRTETTAPARVPLAADTTHVRCAAYVVPYLDAAADVEIRGARTEALLRLEPLEAPATLRIRCANDAGEALDRVPLVVRRADGTGPEARVHWGDGIGTVPDLVPGSWAVALPADRATQPPWRWFRPARVVVPVERGATVSVDLRLERAGEVRIVERSSPGRMFGLRIDLERDGATVTSPWRNVPAGSDETLPEGTQGYASGLIAPGHYRVRIRRPGHPGEDVQDVVVLPGRATDVRPGI